MMNHIRNNHATSSELDNKNYQSKSKRKKGFLKR